MNPLAIRAFWRLAVCGALLFPNISMAQPLELAIGSWVCSSAHAHDAAVTEMRSGAGVMAVRKRLEDEGECIYIDDDALEDLMAPFVTVLESNQGHSRVTFVIEHYRRLAMLHRKFARMQYTGWTDSGNVRPR